MAATTTLQRVPFGEVSASRLQSLQSAKNRQNAVSDLLKSPKADGLSAFKSPPSKPATFQLTSPSKRPASQIDNSPDSDHNSDGENVDPSATHQAKRAKSAATPFSPRPLFALTPKAATVTPPLLPITSVKRKHASDPTESSLSSVPASAPAGRVYAHPRVSLLSKHRPSPSPFKRIDPPKSFDFNKGAAVPFSIDAAINGTLSRPRDASSKVPSLKKAMPTGWFFAIHEDTPDEEMALIMEHETGTLDLSSDDEEGPAQKKLKRGKENIAPDNYVQAAVARPSAAERMSDEEGDRSPLSELAPEDYFANGMDKDSVAVVNDDVSEAIEEQADAGAEEAVEEPVVVEETVVAEKPDEDLEAAVAPLNALPSPGQVLLAAAGDEGSAFLIAEDPATP